MLAFLKMCLCAHVLLKEDWRSNFPSLWRGGWSKERENSIYHILLLQSLHYLRLSKWCVHSVITVENVSTSTGQHVSLQRDDINAVHLCAHWKGWTLIKLFDCFIEPSALQTSKFLRDLEWKEIGKCKAGPQSLPSDLKIKYNKFKVQHWNYY